jgi:hypothetical protein
MFPILQNGTLGKYLSTTRPPGHLTLTGFPNPRNNHTGTMSSLMGTRLRERNDRLHDENVSLYMFIGLFVAFVLISTFVISIELYKSGRCKWQNRAMKKFDYTYGI